MISNTVLQLKKKKKAKQRSLEKCLIVELWQKNEVDKSKYLVVPKSVKKKKTTNWWEYVKKNMSHCSELEKLMQQNKVVLVYNLNYKIIDLRVHTNINN